MLSALKGINTFARSVESAVTAAVRRFYLTSLSLDIGKMLACFSFLFRRSRFVVVRTVGETETAENLKMS